MDQIRKPGSDEYRALPAAELTIDQVVAWNLRHWRVTTGITQEELGRRIGWSAANISAAERSVEEHRDRRRFDAQTITELAEALGIPVSALFLPPADDGIARRYQWQAGGSGERDMRDLMRTAIPDNLDETDVMDAFRDRFRGAVDAYLGEKLGEQVADWFAPRDDKAARAEQAERFRARAAALMRMAAEDADLADFLDGDES